MTNSEESKCQDLALITLNQRGRTTKELNEYQQEFVNFASPSSSPVLDIGAAFGVATLPALAKGARVIANDIESRHLQMIRAQVSEADLERLELKVGKFPDEINFPENSLGAILASNLLNFLTGDEISRGVSLMFKWLRPGGKVFTISGTPYVGNLKEFIPVYQSRKQAGVTWPGEIENPQSYSSHFTIKELPNFIHLLDDSILANVFAEEGFIVEKAEMFLRRNLPDYLLYDGRENVGLIGKKPQTST